MNKYKIDFTDCRYIYDIHKAIKTGLDFSDYYGENWDAFWDCITDFPDEEFCIEIIGFDKLNKIFADEINIMFKLLLMYRQKYNPHLIIKILYDDDECLI